MSIQILSPRAIRFEPSNDGPLFSPTYEPPSAFHLLAGGLASCTHAVLSSWASSARLDESTLAIEVSWCFDEHPHRVRQFDLRIDWPTLPSTRVGAAERVAMLCPLHATLTHLPQVDVILQHPSLPAPRAKRWTGETREPSYAA